jgi:tRNA-2-methylthio-N6-dimethylallyladenosine synthase
METYGCQMNFADSEIVSGILHDHDFRQCDSAAKADVILVNTCSIRDHAEKRIYGRLENLAHLKRRKPRLVLGVLGCMAERLRQDLIEERKLVDIVCGPDEYRALPAMIDDAMHGEKGVRVELSLTETYGDIAPLRTEGLAAWLAVMRGCNNFCAYCVVPYTRGRERSRDLKSIVAEAGKLSAGGYRELTLLGQNVNSYNDNGSDFADLLSAVAAVDRSMRVRFTTSHPRDMSMKLIETIAAHENLCESIQLPVQSGSNRVLNAMNRGYSREQYLERVGSIRSVMPNASLTTDLIAGFPGETDEDHEQTLDLMRQVRFDGAFMFKYSPRENTKAWDLGDDIPDDLRTRRLNDIIELQHRISRERNRAMIGARETILLEGPSKRNPDEWMGRTGGNKPVIVADNGYIAGQYIDVEITGATSATLFGRAQDNVHNPEVHE